MLSKKIILALIIISGAFASIMSSCSKSLKMGELKKTPSKIKKIKANDVEKDNLRNRIKKKIENVPLKNFSDINIKEKTFEEKEEILQELQDIYFKVARCLNEESGYCGQRKKEKGLFFDPLITPYHRVLNENLEVVLEMIHSDEKLSTHLNEDFLIKALSLQHESIPEYALDLLIMKYEGKDEPLSFDKVMGSIQNIEGEMKAKLISNLRLFMDMDEDHYSDVTDSMFVKEIQKIIKEGNDINFIKAMVEKLPGLYFEEKNWLLVAESLCEFLSGVSHDKEMIKSFQRLFIRNKLLSGYDFKFSCKS